MNAALRHRLRAEFAATAPPSTFGARAVVALGLGHGQLDYAEFGVIALLVPVIAAAVHVSGTTSGAHINPAVTCSPAVVPPVGGVLAARACDAIASAPTDRRAAAESPAGQAGAREDLQTADEQKPTNEGKQRHAW